MPLGAFESWCLKYLEDTNTFYVVSVSVDLFPSLLRMLFQYISFIFLTKFISELLLVPTSPALQKSAWNMRARELINYKMCVFILKKSYMEGKEWKRPVFTYLLNQLSPTWILSRCMNFSSQSS